MTIDKERHAAFLAAVTANPLDEDLRNVFADWLEEQDQPEEADRQRKFLPSRAWMRAFARKHHAYGKYHDWEKEDREGVDGDGNPVEERTEEFYQEFLEFLKGHLEGGRRSFGFDLPYEFDEYSEEMWGHFEILTGLKAPEGEHRMSKPSMGCAC